MGSALLISSRAAMYLLGPSRFTSLPFPPSFQVFRLLLLLSRASTPPFYLNTAAVKPAPAATESATTGSAPATTAAATAGPSTAAKA